MIGAIDIGGTKIAIGVIDDAGRLRARREIATAPERGFDHAAARMIPLVRETAQEAGATLRGIGVGSSGPIDHRTGIYGRVDNLPGWEGNDLRAALEGALGVRVVVENDADAAALGEAWSGAGRGARVFVYVTISTGIGGGVVIDGHLFRGVDGAHPEVGHHVIEASGPPCVCGARGCWEALASGPAMAAWAKTQAPADEPAEGWTAASVCRRAVEGAAWAQRAVEREAFYLGVGLANVTTMYCPDVIALGGGVMRSAELFLDRARALVLASATNVPAEKTRIVTAALGGDVGLIGAARAFMLREPS